MQGWLTNTNQVDEMGEDFFKGCFEARSKLCPLRHDKDSSASDVSDRTWEWIKNLDEEPLTLPTSDGTNIFIRSGDIRTLFRWAMYNANYLYRPFSKTISDAMKGNTEIIRRTLRPLQDRSERECMRQVKPQAVGCIDGRGPTKCHHMSRWRRRLAP